MHKQIISNLAFSPTTMSQVSFYAKRLKKEESIRRLGLVLVLFSMFIQIFAATVPPEKSVSASDNDVVRGGVKNIKQFKNAYDSKADVRALYKRFGIEPGDITAAKTREVSFNFPTQGAQGTKTVGRVNYTYTNDHKLKGKFAGEEFFSRSAAEWGGSTPAIRFNGQHKGTDGRYFEVWIIKDCGNIAFRPVDGKLDSVIEGPKVKTVTPAPFVGTTPTPAPTPTPTPTPPPTPQPQPEPEPELNPETHRKTAINVTQGLSAEETPGSKVKANDVIEYSLITTNPNDQIMKDYLVEDYIGDLLDYADLDEQFLVKQGGTYDAASKKVIWTIQTIPAKGELKNTFRIKMKPSIPVTNNPNTTAPDYDCKMQNGYGNEVVLNVDCSVVKTVETLPNTGPGTTIAIAVSISTLSGYFLMRNRMLSKEVGIIKRFYQTAT
jgi:hypothetical protein